MPELAVVMAAYNADTTIRAAVESVLTSTVGCSVYVVDDNSRTPVSELLSDLADRVTFLRMRSNVGPAGARNAALDIILRSDFQYVAVMDADDISTPDRLDKQYAFMEARSDLGACSTFLREFDENTGETVQIFERPTDPTDVRNISFFTMGINHASTMFRADVLRDVGVYSVKYKATEDYELLRRINARYSIANIPECLLHYRISTQGQSHRLRKRQQLERVLIQLKYFELLEWRAWAGVARSVVALIIPSRLAPSS